MQVTFEASEQELKELAKIMYLVQFVMDDSSNKDYNTKGYVYENIKEFDQTKRLINKMLLEYIPASGLLEVDGRSEHIFTHTVAMEDIMRKVLDTFGDTSFYGRICTAITNRDFAEQGGNVNEAELFFDGVYKILYDNNMKELMEFGLSRFKIEM
jgi:hypothetical protein